MKKVIIISIISLLCANLIYSQVDERIEKDKKERKRGSIIDDNALNDGYDACFNYDCPLCSKCLNMRHEYEVIFNYLPKECIKNGCARCECHFFKPEGALNHTAATFKNLFMLWGESLENNKIREYLAKIDINPKLGLKLNFEQFLELSTSIDDVIMHNIPHNNIFHELQNRGKVIALIIDKKSTTIVKSYVIFRAVIKDKKEMYLAIDSSVGKLAYIPIKEGDIKYELYSFYKQN